MKKFLKKRPLLLLLFLLLPTALCAQHVDSLLTRSEALLDAGHPRDALGTLQEALKKDPGHLPTLLLLGRAHFDSGDLNRAQRAFEEALNTYASSAVAQTGIAEIHYRKAFGWTLSTNHLRQAVSAAHRATRMDPEYAPAYIALGRGYEALNKNYAGALRAYTTALELQPDDLEAAMLLANAYIEYRRQSHRDRDRDRGRASLDDHTLELLERHTFAPAFLPLVAQIYLDLGETGKAFETFEQYIQSLSETEREFFRDIRFVSTQTEAEVYAQTPEEVREDYLHQFWFRRNPDPFAEVNERRIEHFRRVWYAREYFGKGKTPWDRRGDVYVRYGDPDHRARSGQANPDMTTAVIQVKERLALALYGPEAMDNTFIGPVFPVRSNESFVGRLNPFDLEQFDEGENLLGRDIYIDDTEEGGGPAAEAIQEYQRRQMRPETRHHYLPVTTQGDMSIVPWESWVYANIGEGIEITFTDEMGNGIYDYAPIPGFPDEGSVGLHHFGQYIAFAPAVVTERSLREIPEAYVPGGPMSGLGFAYDFADFRGSDNQTRLEIYYAIDPTEMDVSASGDTLSILADCSAILTDEHYEQIFRADDTILFRALGNPRWPQGAFIPTLLAMEVPPGDYLLTVQVSDRVSQRKGIYRHRVQVEDYSRDSLLLSDVHLSWHIAEQGDAKFQKGDINVVPMTTRAYREGQSAYVYYEIYNLKISEFGETRYRITYTIGAEDPVRPFNLVRSSVGALARLFRRDEKTQVQVGFDQVDTQSDIAGYFELSLAKVRPGHNRLTVSVEDLNSDQSTAKQITFRYKK